MSELDSWSLKEKKKKWMAMFDNIVKRSNNQHNEPVADGTKDLKLYHGLSLISTIKLLGEYLSICYCSDAQEYFVLDDGRRVHRYSMQGKLIPPSFVLTSSMVFTQMIWCSDIKILSCFAHDGDLIWILTPQFKFIKTIKNEFKVKNLFYLPGTNELLVIGATNITRYLMQKLDKTLECYQTINFTDDYSGPFWVIQQSSLMQYNSSFPSIAASYMTTIYIFPTSHDENVGSYEPVTFMAKKSNASSALITALHFDCTSQWIISGDQLGNVFGWSVSLECTLKCLDGHRGAVKMIVSHPSICGFITTAEDDVLQVWSCILREKMESFKDLGTIIFMAINPSASSLATLGVKLNFFLMQQLYSFYSPLSAPVTILFSTITHPTRIIVRTSDNNVSVLSAVGGKQLNIAMLPLNEIPISIAYSEIRKQIYTVLSDTGKIIVSTIETRPMEVREVWENNDRIITCLVVYDHYDEIHRSDRRIQHPKFVRPIRERIIIGTTAGEIASVDEKTGKCEPGIVAHRGRVEKLYASTAARHIFSIGEDNWLKIWRMLPTIAFPIALINYIYHINPIANIASMGFTICFVSNSYDSQSHQLLMYEIKERLKLEHHPSKDHSGHISGLATSESLLICATSADDGTIRVWNHQNHLIKILEVNVTTRELAFSSLRGDIVFSAGKHLYRLPYQNYLSAKSRAEILTHNIPEEDEELIINHDKYREYEEDEDKKKSLHPVSSVPLGSLDPSVDAPCLQLISQQHVFIQLKSRDEDIIKIKDGMIETMRRVKKRAIMSHENWEKHVDELIGGFKELNEDIIPVHNLCRSIENYRNVKKRFKSPLREKKIYDKCSVGFVPNSVVVDISAEEKTMAISPISRETTKLKFIYPDELQDDQTLLDDPKSFVMSMLEDQNSP